MIKNIILALCICIFAHSGFAQSTLKVIVQDSASAEKLFGAAVNVEGKPKISGVTDFEGVVILKGLEETGGIIIVKSLGYNEKRVSWRPNGGNSSLTVLLSSSETSTEEVIITSTRTNSRLEDAAMKVEVLGEEELDEEAAIVPGNVASILGDISIIHIQKLSPVNGNQGIRMQGLDVKYTQILRDGLPLYEGFSGNLGVLQIPPLDLKQVEIIKGSVSTLYGGGAIGGLVNLISKMPSAHPVGSLVLNRSNLKETNGNVFFAQRVGKLGFSFFGGVTNQEAVDVNHDGFSDSPQIKQITVHPRLFYEFSDKTKGNLGYSYTTEDRAGGDITALKNADTTHRYFNKNKVQRHTMDLYFTHNAGRHSITIKGSGSYFTRETNDTGYIFKGAQTSLFTEVNDRIVIGHHTLVGGVNYINEAFTKNAITNSPINNFQYSTTGVFLQDSWLIGSHFTLQPGLRYDHHNTFGDFLLPSLATIYKFNSSYTLRVNVGSGYKTPNVFSLATPITSGLKSGLQYLDPLVQGIKAERSTGVNLDLAVKKVIGENLVIQLDQALFYTHINNPIVAQPNGAGQTEFANASFYIQTMGTDTYLRTTYKQLEFYLGYNHTLAQRLGSGDAFYLPFAPQDKCSFTLAYSVPSKWRFGIEASWVGNQYLYANNKVPNYWFFAAMVERQIDRLHIILNAENIFNVKQSNYGNVYSGTISRPNFSSIWAPQEGIIVNLALKFDLFGDKD